jgi:hypothetical protein
MELYQITASYCCFGIEVKDGIVLNSAPIGAWAIGKKWLIIKHWWGTKRNAKIELV